MQDAFQPILFLISYSEVNQRQTFLINNAFLSTDAVAFSNAHFGAGIGTIYLHIVSCTGRETNLTDCPQAHSDVYCLRGHSDDAGVRCQGLEDKHIMMLHLSEDNYKQY